MICDLDDAISHIPLGYFHYRLLLLCGLSFIADGMVIVHFLTLLHDFMLSGNIINFFHFNLCWRRMGIN
jgi:hypothetical protein